VDGNNLQPGDVLLLKSGVRGGWTAARQLRVGDALRSHDGQWLAVESVRDTGREEAVYNCRVAEYHTYFVGDQQWGFSVWAHNSYNPTNAPAALCGSQQGAARLQGRAQQLFEAQTGHGNTVAVIRGRHRVTGEERTFVSMNGNRQTAPGGWTLNEGEQWVPGTSRTAHAEENILNNPALRDWEFIEGGVSRNVCSTERCGAAIQGAGMELGGPAFPGRQGTTLRMFWRQ
jgi:hypothetical protein